MQKSYEYHSVTLSVKMRHAGDQFAKKTWQFFRVWSWFWYKILPEIIWKKGWSIFFKLAFEYQELRTHTTTQTYFKKNLWHWAPHESWNPPGQLKKKSKTTNARPRRESARLRRKCLDSVSRLRFPELRWVCWRKFGPFWGSDLLDHMCFFSPEKFGFLGFFGGGCPMWRFF